MSIPRTLVLFGASAALVLAAAGCGGDDSGGGTQPTPGITSISQSSGTGVSSLVTPFPTPQVADNQVDSSASKGYTATLPAGWNFYPNRIQTRDASVDVVFEPLRAGATAQASIAINCIVTKQADQAQHVAAEGTKTARIGTNSEIVMGERAIAGLTATTISYRFESPNEQNIPPLRKQDVVFSNERCDWIITMTTPLEQEAEFAPVFDAFLDSFRLA